MKDKILCKGRRIWRSVGVAIASCVLFGVGCAFARPSNCNRPAANPAVKVDLPGRPFEALASPDGCWIFVSLLPGAPKWPPPTAELMKWNRVGRGSKAEPGGIAVLQRRDGKVSLERVVPLFPSVPAGIVLTHDGKLLIVADGLVVAFLDEHRLESGKGSPFLGLIRNGNQPGSVYVNVSPDDRLLFVSDERMHQVSVINLDVARRSGFAQSSLIGSIPVGLAPVGLAFSRDGRYLFVTSELWRPPEQASSARRKAPASNGSARPQHQGEAANWPVTCEIETARKLPPRLMKARRPQGAVSVVSVAKAGKDPSHAVIENVPAGCSPVRDELAPDGETLFVTARNSNALLAFDSEKLVADPKHALVASVPVGKAPVGLALVDRGRRAIVANSSRFGGSGGQDLAVVNTSGLRKGKAVVEGAIPVGKFPRELHTTPDGKTLLLTNFGSEQLELIDLNRLQRLLEPAGGSQKAARLP